MSELTEHHFYWYLTDKMLKINLMLLTDNKCNVIVCWE